MKNGVIAFCGSKGSGKSTSATVFKEYFTGPTEELAFAGHLKNTCSKAFNIDMKYFLDPSLKEVELDSYINLTGTNLLDVFTRFGYPGVNYEKFIRPHTGQVFDTPRRLLQYIGTEVLHPVDPLIHVKATLNNKDPNKLSIVTDLRFLQEYQFLKQRNDFLPIYVHNLVAEGRAAADSHPSERQVLLFKDECKKLDNNHDMTALTNTIKALVKEYYA